MGIVYELPGYSELATAVEERNEFGAYALAPRYAFVVLNAQPTQCAGRRESFDDQRIAGTEHETPPRAQSPARTLYRFLLVIGHIPDKRCH